MDVIFTICLLSGVIIPIISVILGLIDNIVNLFDGLVGISTLISAMSVFHCCQPPVPAFVSFYCCLAAQENFCCFWRLIHGLF